LNYEVNTRIGTAGWSISRDVSELIACPGSHLERYSSLLNCAEINSTFSRTHKPSTFARWAASTPETFRFSVKMHKSITHECALSPGRTQLQSFFDQARMLGPKLGPILVQLPPRQAFEVPVATEFFDLLRDVHSEGPIALEPRHPSWFSAEAEALLERFTVSPVIADPAIAGTVAEKGACTGLIYRRLHGSPRVYYSSYSEDELQNLEASISGEQPNSETWCIFDNTASGAALRNALDLEKLTHKRCVVASTQRNLP
jgi:uncharacterized protein YecE (DUF72 family)